MLRGDYEFDKHLRIYTLGPKVVKEIQPRRRKAANVTADFLQCSYFYIILSAYIL
jgi:hypothetical protein